MGVPGLLRNILDKMKDVHFWDDNFKIDYLFFDFNPIIYDCARELELLKTWNFSEPKDNTKFENELITYIMKKTKEIVTKLVKPTKLLYIAIDGPPPLSKIKQQRLRRFEKVKYQKFLKKEYPNEYVEGTHFDTNQFTPGTNFMYKLNKRFKKDIESKKFGNIEVVFNGSDIPGEAEHKFLPFIKKIDVKKDDRYCVYSKDADQIVLLLKYTDRKMYILQPLKDKAIEENYPDSQEFFYLDVNKVAEQWGDSILESKRKNKRRFQKGGNHTNFSFLNDFIFLTFLEGNDFVMPIYFLKYKEDYLRTLLGIYKFNRKSNKNLRLIHVNNGVYSINSKFLISIFKRLSDIEDGKLNEKNIRVQNLISKFNLKNKKALDRCKEGMDQIEHNYLYCPNHPFFKTFIKEWNNLFKDDKFNKKYFYQYFFGNKYNLDKICEEYAKALIFNLKYYFGEKVYWRFKYDYLASPLPSDFYNYLKKNPDIFNKLKFDEGEPFNPFVQLSYVLPKESQQSLPSKLTKIIKEISNKDIEYDLLSADKLQYCEVKLPDISILDIEKQFEKIYSSLSKTDKDRCQIEKKEFIFFSDKKKSN